MSCHFTSLSLSLLLSPITFLLYVQDLAVIPGASWCQTVEDLLLMPAAASGCPAQLFELLSWFLMWSACGWNFLSSLDAFSLWLTLNYLEFIFPSHGGNKTLQLLLSTCMEDICSSNRENSFLPLYVDIFLGGDCTLKLAVTLKLLHARWAYAGTMSANGRAFAELVANFFTVYFLPKIT